jgi:RimJ/RimL family protein N-acetyltransferase
MEEAFDSNAMRAIDAAYREPRVMGKLPAMQNENGVRIFRSRDYAAIRALATHPRIFPHICDDFTSDPKAWTPIESELVTYLLATDQEGPFGFGIFIPDTWACWKSHTAFLPRSYGVVALTSFKQMLAWMWANSQARRLVGEIDRANILAIRFARRAGFQIYGINRQSFLKGGELRDRVCLGISKPE